jgi:glucose/arabinose dehydrogenase
VSSVVHPVSGFGCYYGVTVKLLLLVLALPTQDPGDSGKGSDMDYGPFFSSTLSRTKSERDGDILAFKALSIKVGKNAAVCYDTDLLRMAGAWTGGFLDLSFTHMATMKGLFPTRPGGPLKFATKVGPGWGKGGDFKDPRPQSRGPLPRDWAQYKGLFVDGDQVVLSYTVGSVPVLEMPGFLESGSATAFTRTFNLGPADAPLKLLVVDDDAPGHVDVGLAAAPGTATLETSGRSTVLLDIPAHAAPARFMVVLWIGPKGDLSGVKQLPDLSAHCKGGPSHWPAPLVTKGVLGKDEGPLAIDTLTLPDDNPWKSWLRTSALDFFPDGRAAVSTWSGDVWICSGIDAGLGQLRWKRFATGLYEPLGLKIVDNTIYVLGRDQITRLRDLNGDGEADSYESFCNLGVTMASYHAFHYDLQTDREGNFYYLVGGNHVEPGVLLHNCLLKVSKDGSSIEPIATGFRATNGMAIGPNDEIVCADNEGNWMPAERVDWIRKGAFYGFVSDPAHTNAAHPAPNWGEPEPPLCWIPQPQDNSSGGQVWATSDKWGPLKGHLLHTSYGTASLFHILTQNVSGVLQGGVVRFPQKFATGIMRARFNPADGELYVTGLRGWQTAGVRDGALQRVRVTGKPFHTIVEMNVVKGGIALTFSEPLDPETAADAGSYAVQQWNYEISSKYGSADWSVADPKKKGRDTLEVASAKLSSDGKTVTLELPGLRPVMQMGIKVRVRSADAAQVSLELYLTIHKVPQ